VTAGSQSAKGCEGLKRYWRGGQRAEVRHRAAAAATRANTPTCSHATRESESTSVCLDLKFQFESCEGGKGCVKKRSSAGMSDAGRDARLCRGRAELQTGIRGNAPRFTHAVASLPAPASASERARARDCDKALSVAERERESGSGQRKPRAESKSVQAEPKSKRGRLGGF
jgi:hypothetical protein